MKVSTCYLLCFATITLSMGAPFPNPWRYGHESPLKHPAKTLSKGVSTLMNKLMGSKIRTKIHHNQKQVSLLNLIHQKSKSDMDVITEAVNKLNPSGDFSDDVIVHRTKSIEGKWIFRLMNGGPVVFTRDVDQHDEEQRIVILSKGQDNLLVAKEKMTFVVLKLKEGSKDLFYVFFAYVRLDEANKKDVEFDLWDDRSLRSNFFHVLGITNCDQSSFVSCKAGEPTSILNLSKNEDSELMSNINEKSENLDKYDYYLDLRNNVQEANIAGAAVSILTSLSDKKFNSVRERHGRFKREISDTRGQMDHELAGDDPQQRVQRSRSDNRKRRRGSKNRHHKTRHSSSSSSSSESHEHSHRRERSFSLPKSAFEVNRISRGTMSAASQDETQEEKQKRKRGYLTGNGTQKGNGCFGILGWVGYILGNRKGCDEKGGTSHGLITDVVGLAGYAPKTTEAPPEDYQDQGGYPPQGSSQQGFPPGPPPPGQFPGQFPPGPPPPGQFGGQFPPGPPPPGQFTPGQFTPGQFPPGPPPPGQFPGQFPPGPPPPGQFGEQFGQPPPFQGRKRRSLDDNIGFLDTLINSAGEIMELSTDPLESLINSFREQIPSVATPTGVPFVPSFSSEKLIKPKLSQSTLSPKYDKQPQQETLDETTSLLGRISSDLFTQLGWFTQKSNGPDVLWIRRKQFEVFVGFGTCVPTRDPNTIVHEKGNAGAAIDLNLSVLRTNCDPALKTKLMSLFNMGCLVANGQYSLDVPSSCHLVSKAKLSREETNQLIRAFEISSFSQAYNSHMKDESHFDYDQSTPRSIQTLQTMILEGFKITNKLSPKHLIKITRFFINILKTALTKTLQDYVRLEECHSCFQMYKTLSLENSRTIVALIEFIVGHAEPSRINFSAFQTFLEANSALVDKRLNEYLVLGK